MNPLELKSPINVLCRKKIWFLADFCRGTNLLLCSLIAWSVERRNPIVLSRFVLGHTHDKIVYALFGVIFMWGSLRKIVIMPINKWP